MTNGFSIDPLLDLVAERIAMKVGRQLSSATPQARQRLLTVEQAASYLGRTKAGVQHLITARALPVVRSDRRVMLDVRDLDEWIEQNKRPL